MHDHMFWESSLLVVGDGMTSYNLTDVLQCTPRGHVVKGLTAKLFNLNILSLLAVSR